MASYGLFVGLSTLDVLQLVERLPAPDEKIRALDHTMAAGGPASNAAVAFAALGGEATLLTSAADGPVWRLVEQDLEEHGVNVVRVSSKREPTVASIMVTKATGERAVVSGWGTGFPAHGVPEGIDVSAFDVVLVDGHEIGLAAEVASRARIAGIPVVMDGGSWKDTTPRLLPLVDAAIVSSAFRPPHTDPPEQVFNVLSLSDYRAITRGADGVLAEHTERFEIPARRVNVVDTLGAGDFFHGAFSYHVATYGLSKETFRDALLQGTETAAESVQWFGTREWLTHRAQQ